MHLNMKGGVLTAHSHYDVQDLAVLQQQVGERHAFKFDYGIP